MKSMPSFQKPTIEMLCSDSDRCSLILDSLPQGLIAHDKDRHILFINRTAERITGYSREEVVGKDCHEAFYGAFCGSRCSFCDGAPDSWQDLGYPVNFVTKDGKTKQLSISALALTDEDGEFRGVLATFRDITTMAGLKSWSNEQGFPGIVGRDPKMLEIFRQVRALAVTDYPVLVTGETGSGKELVAAAIHAESRRSSGPYVIVNCGALPEGLIESELFGHVKGAFSGAARDRKGRFELADGGTIFLDEIGEISKNVQVKLLRVLENGQFERVGDEKTMSVDVRIISATNRNLRYEVDRKAFREDLYYRLNVVPIQLPSLRERRSDIRLLVDHFTRRAQKPGENRIAFSAEAMKSMVRHNWPGNVRELQNAVSYALAHHAGTQVEVDDLPWEVRGGASKSVEGKLNETTVREALEQSSGNKAKAARLLGVGRATLYRFLVSHETPLSHE